MIFLLRDLFQSSSGHSRQWGVLRDAEPILAAFELVMFFDQKPVWLAFTRSLAAHPHERPFSLHLCAMHHKFEATRVQACVHVFGSRLRFPCSLVPHHHRTAPILSLWDDAFESAVLHRMIFYLNGKPAVTGKVTRSFGDRPALEHSVPTQAKVVVQVTRCVLLNHKWKTSRWLRPCSLDSTTRLCSHMKIAHRPITRKLLVHSICSAHARLFFYAWCGQFRFEANSNCAFRCRSWSGPHSGTLLFSHATLPYADLRF